MNGKDFNPIGLCVESTSLLMFTIDSSQDQPLPLGFLPHIWATPLLPLLQKKFKSPKSYPTCENPNSDTASQLQFKPKQVHHSLP